MILMGMRTKTRRARARELLDKVGLAGRAHHKPNELSAGRCSGGIARALANERSSSWPTSRQGISTPIGNEILALFRTSGNRATP